MKRRDLIRMLVAVPAGLAAVPAARLLPVPGPDVFTIGALRQAVDLLNRSYTPPKQFIISEGNLRQLIAMTKENPDA